MSETLLSLVGVGKSFKEVDALTHVDLEIKSGQVIGLVGGNGAGKTTLLRLMAGVMEPSKGTIMFQEKPVSSMRSKLGVVPESTGLYSRLTAWENIRYHSRIYGIDDEVAWNRVNHFAGNAGYYRSSITSHKGIQQRYATKDCTIACSSPWT